MSSEGRRDHPYSAGRPQTIEEEKAFLRMSVGTGEGGVWICPVRDLDDTVHLDEEDPSCPSLLDDPKDYLESEEDERSEPSYEQPEDLTLEDIEDSDAED